MKKWIFGAMMILALAGAAFAVYRLDLVPGWARGNAARATDAGPFCEDHGVPEQFCTICHPDLKAKLLLCPEHGNIPEDICTLCHKDAAAKYGIKLCPRGHGLPEHFCVKCGTEPTASATGLIDDGYCAAVGDPAQADGKPKYCKLLPLVRLASADVGRDIGIETTRVAETEQTPELRANAETAYDANRYAEIYPRLAGFLREVRVDLGRTVAAGAVVAVVDSAEVSMTKTQYQTADATLRLGDESLRRTKELADQQIVGSRPLFEAQITMQQARTSFLNAEQKLRNFRFDEAALAQILKNHDTRPTLEITAPIPGTVVFRHAVVGEAVEAATKLLIVADTTTMWLWIDIYDQDIAQVHADQAVQFTAAGREATDETAVVGRITWVGTELDHTTRTIKVRAEIPNPEGLIRANQFGTATIAIGARHKAITIARAAVQRHENADLVFLPQADNTYRPQRIRTKPGARPDALEVIWGIQPGQEVVTTGAFLLKTEIMKGSIGAGCCD